MQLANSSSLEVVIIYVFSSTEYQIYFYIVIFNKYILFRVIYGLQSKPLKLILSREKISYPGIYTCSSPNAHMLSSNLTSHS